MKNTLSWISSLLLCIVATAALLQAQDSAKSDSAKTDTTGSSKIEPGAMEALQKMGAYLRTLKAFQVHSESTSEIVLDDGQKVQLAQNTNMVARRPDRFMAEIEGDQGAKNLFFDGKSFTFFARDEGYYATVNAPPTLGKLVDVLQDKYDVEIPLADLFLWGQDDSESPKITAASDIGAGQVSGISCEHYAFRQDGLDWQVWIQKGDYPLPKKLVLTTTTDDARPQHTSVLTWNLAPSFNDATFAFDPPPGTHKIDFKENSANNGN